jgi:hypothetical protein
VLILHGHEASEYELTYESILYLMCINLESEDVAKECDEKEV